MDPQYCGSEDMWAEEAMERLCSDPEFWDDLEFHETPMSQPDTLTQILQMTDRVAALSAERLRAVEELRQEAIDESERTIRAGRDIVERSVRLELAAAMRITERAAEALMLRADALVNRYPRALEFLSHGTITERHADLYTEAMDELEPHEREQIAEHALTLAEQLPVGTYRRSLQKLVDTVRAPTLSERHEGALTKRKVTIMRDRDGMGWLSLYAPMVELHAVYDRATRMSKVLRDQDGQTRTVDQLRADLVCDLLLEGEVRAHPKRARGIRAEVIVTVPVLSLFDNDTAAKYPASVEGIGPIPIERARELCGNADGWMRVLTHPETGVVLSVGRKKYRPPAALRRLVQWRSGRCLGPGCGMPAHRCDIDHSVPWEHGGITAAWNLGPLCRGHHTLRHHGDWKITQLDGGVIEWTSPLGRTYLVEPERRTPTFRPDPGADRAQGFRPDCGADRAEGFDAAPAPRRGPALANLPPIPQYGETPPF
jgi:hypothetical protein